MSIVYYKKLQNIFKKIFEEGVLTPFSCKFDLQNAYILHILQVLSTRNVKTQAKNTAVGSALGEFCFCGHFN